MEIYEEPKREVWDDIAGNTESSTVYHRTAWLDVLSTSAKLSITRIVVDIDGDPSIGLPVGLRQLGPVRAVVSPPRRFGIEYLGPALKRSLAVSHHGEKRWLEAMNRVLLWIDERFRPGLVYVRNAPFIRDIRPFTWRDYRVNPLYTYLDDISMDAERLLGIFDRTVRSDIARTSGKVEVRPGGRELVRDIHAFVSARYRTGGETFGPSLSYLLRLYDALGPTYFQPIGVYTERGLEGGAIITFHGVGAAFWQGGTDPNHSR